MTLQIKTFEFNTNITSAEEIERTINDWVNSVYPPINVIKSSDGYLYRNRTDSNGNDISRSILTKTLIGESTSTNPETVAKVFIFDTEEATANEIEQSVSDWLISVYPLEVVSMNDSYLYRERKISNTRTVLRTFLIKTIIPNRTICIYSSICTLPVT